MQKFLMIQNPGIAPVESYTLLGVSLTRDCGVDGTIGQFASGAKNAIALLLRQGLTPIVYCGKQRLEFSVKKHTVDDGIRSKDFGKIHCKISGEKPDGGTINRTVSLGFTVEMGESDWTNLNMALREFVSNAIDHTLRNGMDFAKAIKDEELVVDLVDENQVRAKNGGKHTRIFVEATPEIIKFFAELPLRFLHFSHPEWVTTHRILPKMGSLDGTNTAMIYKQGVFVRQVGEGDEQVASLFNYNFGTDFRLDECRNASDYEVKSQAGRCLSLAEPDILAEVFRSLVKMEATWESKFDSSDLSPRYEWDENKKKKRQENWHKGWDTALGSKTILCREGHQATERVAKKGHTVAAVKADCQWMEAAERLGTIPTPLLVLNENEHKGRELLPPTTAATEAVDIVWDWIALQGRTNGKQKPAIGCFKDTTEGEVITFGFYDSSEKKCYFEEGHASGMNKALLRTAVEELVHHLTGSTDCSRDFQNFVIDLLVDIIT